MKYDKNKSKQRIKNNENISIHLEKIDPIKRQQNSRTST